VELTVTMLALPKNGTVRYFDIELEDAPAIAEAIED
tara:strand:+ start:7473 stop:7580 length:108 start_codon:yes stop_codon:yes gene_type:complete